MATAVLLRFVALPRCVTVNARGAMDKIDKTLLQNGPMMPKAWPKRPSREFSVNGIIFAIADQALVAPVVATGGLSEGLPSP